MSTIYDVLLSGCVPTVLAGYLKALGTHRLVSEQADAGALSYWDGDGSFHLISALDAEALCSFFSERYAPTPIVTPWNGGSGFYPGDQQAGIRAIEDSQDARFASYRRAIAMCRQLLQGMGLGDKPESKEIKLKLLQQMRAWLPDEALAWFDAAVVITDRAMYPALLGTGGIDGRFDFANNLMQRLAELFLLPRRSRRGVAEASTADALRAALLGQRCPGVLRPKLAFGQFAPGLAGGTNMTAGIEDEGRANPWDFILTVEGTLVLAGAAVRRLDSGQYGNASFPFHVNASSVGYGSAAAADRRKASCELWLPLWSAPTPFGELLRFFGEGRLELGGRRATTGLDAARAVASLGLDRGVERFERLAILERRGQSNIAAWLGSFRVPRHQMGGIDLLKDLERDDLLVRLERAEEMGAAVGTAARGLLSAVFEACRRAGQEEEPPLTEVLMMVGRLSRARGRSPKAQDKLRPLGLLRSEWYARAFDRSPEFLVATAFVSMGGRPELGGWTERDPLENMVSIALRRLRLLGPGEGVATVLGGSGHGEPMDGLALSSLLGGALDRQRLTDLIFGLAQLEGLGLSQPLKLPGPEDLAGAGALFGLLRAATSPFFLRSADKVVSGKAITALLTRLLAGDVDGAIGIAEGRLRASGGRARIARVAELAKHELKPGDRLALGVALILPLRRPVENKFIENAVRMPDRSRSKEEEIHDQPEGA